MDLPGLNKTPNLQDRRVILRLDLNVPVENGAIVDDFRIRRVMPTISLLRKAGARIVLVSHRSDGGSLEPLIPYLSNIAPTDFVSDVYAPDASAHASKGAPGSFLLLENVRFWKGEQQNDEAFGKLLASFGDVYVNDAFSVSHREHASIMQIPGHLPSYAGLLLEDEVANLSHAFNPPHPFFLILGGGKVRTKVPLIEKFVSSADTIFIGGALAHSFFKARGLEIGKSLYEETDVDFNALYKSGKIVLPRDVAISSNGKRMHKKPEEVTSDEMILDAGPETIADLEDRANKAAFILWNGPVGDYPEEGFDAGTKELISIVARSPAETIAGGGDTTALISRAGKEKEFGFISTGGGAMIQFLADGTLPGIEALK